jgi:hypothetical protein
MKIGFIGFGHHGETYQGTRLVRDSNMAFWFALFSPLIGLISGLIFAWFFSSLAE